MNDETRLDEFLLEWRLGQREGRAPSPEQLCADEPGLLGPLRQRIEAVESMEALLGPVLVAARGGTGEQHSTGAHETPAPGLEGPWDTRSWPSEGMKVLAPAQAPGEMGRLGPYLVRGLLGEGGMGLVLRAEDPILRRQLAIKIMRPELAVKPRSRERFLREALAAAAVEHEHAVSIYHVGEQDGVPF